MLSTKYRLRLESICKDIASGTEVSLEDMIWSSKLAKAWTFLGFGKSIFGYKKDLNSYDYDKVI